MDPNNPQSDDEAQALAACYRLLLQKAAERRARLAQANQGRDSFTEDILHELASTNGRNASQ
ncbi:MAG: hypothetical protein KC449_09630 [Anaerolineales bacterium]|nr:hypothetical protein [Anaerolineales bacterium]